MIGVCEQAVLDWFTWRVRLATAEQIKEFCAGRSSPVQTLATAKLIEAVDLVVAIPVLKSPLYTWMPGKAAPNFASLAWTLEKRRRDAVPRRTKIFHATERAVGLMGGCGGHLRQ